MYSGIKVIGFAFKKTPTSHDFASYSDCKPYNRIVIIKMQIQLIDRKIKYHFLLRNNRIVPIFNLRCGLAFTSKTPVMINENQIK